MVKIKNHENLSRVLYSSYCTSVIGHGYFWSISLKVLLRNGYKTYLSSSHRHSERKGDIGSCRAY